jgi:hypothetical protein
MELLISNPLMSGNKIYHTSTVSSDDKTLSSVQKANTSQSIELSQSNISKYVQEVYVLVKKSDTQVPINFYKKEINNDVLQLMRENLLLWKVSVDIVKNKKMFDRICIFTKEHCEMFNQFGFVFNENNVVIPILNISFKNLIEYLNNSDGYTLDKLYNIVLLSDYFGDNMNNVKSQLHLQNKIKNLEESSYWEMPYNCLSNLTKSFKGRKFSRSFMKKMEINKEDLDRDNYLEMIFKTSKYVDASNIIEKNGYKLYNISAPCSYDKDEIYQLMKTLDKKNQFFMFSNLMVSKKYCHLVVNNEKVLDLMKDELSSKTSLYRYLMGYAWLRFYFEESIKKRNIDIKDEFIFDINTASKLPIYPFDIKFPKLNPYMPIMVSDEVLKPETNIGGIKNYKYNETSKQYCNQGICTLSEFKRRLNLFVTNNPDYNLFNDIEWQKWKVSLSGSIMSACIQKQHPLLNMFNEKTMDEKLVRYFNEYYASSDIDVMFWYENTLEYMEAVENFFNQIVVNTCVIYTPYAEPEHVKLNKLFQLHYKVNEDWVKKNIVNENITFDFVYKNADDSEIKSLFKPFIVKDYQMYIDKELVDFDEEEKINLKKRYPDFFLKADDFDIKIHINLNKESVEPTTSVKINYKYRITSPYFNHPLEIFKIHGTGQMGAVSQFHLPCVRALYNGDNVYLTPSCISAHLTFMNIDYKYFAGSTDPIEIINKNRMRGFGTWLNETEIKDFLKYSFKVPFWNNLYGGNPNTKLGITSSMGCLPLSHKLFHPRMINADEYYDAPPVSLDNGYNDSFKGEEILTVDDFINEIKFKNKDKLDYSGMEKFVTIDSNGYIKPLQKWIIEAYYNYMELMKESNQEKEKINSDSKEEIKNSSSFYYKKKWDEVDNMDIDNSEEL